MRTIETETERNMALSKMMELTDFVEQFLNKRHNKGSIWSRFDTLAPIVEKECLGVNPMYYGLPVAIRSSVCDSMNDSGRFEYLSLNYDLVTNCVTIHGSRGWDEMDVGLIYRHAKVLFSGFAESVAMSMDID